MRVATGGAASVLPVGASSSCEPSVQPISSSTCTAKASSCEANRLDGSSISCGERADLAHKLFALLLLALLLKRVVYGVAHDV